MSFTPTNFKLRTGKNKSYTEATIVGLYGYNEKEDNMQHIKVSENQNIQVESMELDFNGYAQVLLDTSGAAAVLADSTITPVQDPERRNGWCFTNSVAGTKYNLYYFNGAEEIITLGDVSSVYTKMFIDQKPDNSIMPFFQIYTKPTGSGDSGPFYHSRITYEYDPSDGVVGIGESMVFFAINEPKKAWSERKLEFTSKSVLGDGLPDEEVLYMVVASNSGATTGGVRHCISLLGFNSGSGIQRNLNLVTEAEADGVGLATEAKQDVMITDLSSIDSKLIRGDDENRPDALEVSLYARHPTSADLGLLHMTNGHNLKVAIEETNGTADLATETTLSQVQADVSGLTSLYSYGDGSDQLELPRSTAYGCYNSTTLKAIKLDFAGRVLTQVDAVRANGSETFTIADGTTGTSSSISMANYKYIAFYGDTDNTTNTNIFIEYSQDEVNWFRGAGDNAKIIIVSASGNFYDEEHITPPYVRLSRPNTSGSLETLTLYYTRL